MTARHKLNTASVNGALLIAGLVGFLSQSWLVFGIAAVILIAGAMHNGDVRPRGRPRR